MQNHYVTASEIGEFVYCKRSWWLRQHKLLEETQQMRDGTEGHEAFSRQIIFVRIITFITTLLIVIGSILLALFFLLR